MLRCRGHCRGTALGAVSVLVAVACWLWSLAGFAAETKTCATPVARVVSIQGMLEMRRQGQSQWEPVRRLDTALCAGDLLRTGRNSRGALVIPPESLLRIDQNTTVSISSDNNETALVFSQDGQIPPLATELRNACGAGYVISRFPKQFKVYTPFTYAAVEGTEFLVAMSCTQVSSLSVFEGKVATQLLDDATSRVLVEAGQTATLGPGEPPAVKVLVKPTDAVQWTIFYPPVTERRFTAEETRGDCQAIAEDQRPACLLERAEDLLRAGQADKAEADIKELLTLQPKNGDAQALRAVISLARNDKATALASAREATQLVPDSYLSWLALSYVEQAQFKLDDALKTAQHASELAPSSALVKARVAELMMSLGRIREAEKVAREAVTAYPAGSRGHTILGFVHLAQINTKAAREDFLNAIERDSTDPLPRLGLGLAIIRDGNLVGGREQIEIAVALDPTNSLLRSYVGKAYYEENTYKRDKLAAEQFGIAEKLDPNDPTPWFYAAILKDSQTRPAEALSDVKMATELNDDRAVYRSKLFLDQDLAARGASTASIYNELGFPQLGVEAAAQSLAVDPGSASAHRFLADIDATLPRHEISRASELLQAQLRQPLGAPPLQPQLANDVLFKNTFFGPATVGLNEFNPLFLQDRADLQFFGLLGSPYAYGDQVIFNALSGPVSFSLSQFVAHDSGYRPNNDDTSRQYDAFVQTQISYYTSLQFEASSAKRNSGDLQSAFDPTFFVPNLRSDAQLDTYRLGLRQVIDAQSDLLVSFIYQNQTSSDVTADPAFPFTLDTDQTSKKTEAQYLNRQRQYAVVLGASYFEAEGKFDLIFPSVPFSNTIPLTAYHTNTYGYLYLNPASTLPQLQLGLSYDRLRGAEVGEQEQLNPKVGILWKPEAALTLRAAYFKALKRRVVSDQGLEPTQIVGFNQFFDDPNGATSETTAVGVDLQFSPTISGGAEYEYRRLTSPFVDSPGSIASNHRTEDLVAGYLYWLPTRWLSISFQPRYEQILGSGVGTFDQMELTELPLSARLFLPSGFWFGATLTGVSQSGVFDGPGGVPTPGSDQFALVDALIAYRLPQRSGTISFQVTNLFNRKFSFQEIDQSVPPRYVPERRAFLRLSLAF